MSEGPAESGAEEREPDLRGGIAEDAPDEALPISPELAEMLDRRVEEHEREPDSAIPWPEVRAKILDPTRRRPDRSDLTPP